MRSWLIARWRVNMATGGYMTIREEIEAREEVILSLMQQRVSLRSVIVKRNRIICVRHSA